MCVFTVAMDTMQPAGDLLVAQSLGDQRQHLRLPCGEPVGQRRRTPSAAALGRPTAAPAAGAARSATGRRPRTARSRTARTISSPPASFVRYPRAPALSAGNSDSSSA